MWERPYRKRSSRLPPFSLYQEMEEEAKDGVVDGWKGLAGEQ
jgi:hypothetical protein